MKCLIVHAHPESRSLTASLKNVIVKELEAQGYEVKVSDLYSMNWKASIDRDDFKQLTQDERLNVISASGLAYSESQLTYDVKQEQEKLLWADTVIFTFPLWWFYMPAILKGWIDRVYSCKFAYGVGEHSEKRWGERYGEGVFSGKRAMILVTIGGLEQQYSGRGINGPLEDLLFPINHGLLYYPGFDVLPSFVVYNTTRVTDERFQEISSELREHLRSLNAIKPIPYRKQNSGQYLLPSCVLRDDIKPGLTGYSIHKDE